MFIPLAAATKWADNVTLVGPTQGANTEWHDPFSISKRANNETFVGPIEGGYSILEIRWGAG
jgi:hypothetical protein